MKKIQHIKSAFVRMIARQRIDQAYAIGRYCCGHHVGDVAKILSLSILEIEKFLAIYAMSEQLGEGCTRKLIEKELRKQLPK